MLRAETSPAAANLIVSAPRSATCWQRTARQIQRQAATSIAPPRRTIPPHRATHPVRRRPRHRACFLIHRTDGAGPLGPALTRLRRRVLASEAPPASNEWQG